MQIICISDTHNLHSNLNVPNGDVLIFAGDITAIGEKEDIISFNNWLGTLTHKYKIVIAGNHDFYLEDNPNYSKHLLSNAIYLCDEEITIEGIKFWGSPISPAFHDWAFNRKRGKEIRKHWNLIPNDVDVLITHCPPFGVLDKNEFDENCGCEELLDVLNKKIKPKIHVFGHIHESYGLINQKNITFVNASIIGNKYTKKWFKYPKKALLNIFQIIKSLKKLFFKQDKQKLRNKSLISANWVIKNEAVCISL